ncbi:MAG: ABC transporter ATP-binding protein [Lachnospiraceae bacterium]|nr:ABC transporter ATP-binding protein [Lachnospiraceae bacterium]
MAESKQKMKNKKADSSSMDVLKKVLRVISHYRFLLLLSVILAAVTVVLQLYIPILFGNAIDLVLGPGKVRFQPMRSLFLRILILILLTAVLTWLMNLINNRLTYRTVQDIRSKAIRKIQTLPLSYLDSHSTGDIVQRVIADVDQLSDGLLLGFTQLFSGLVMIFVTLGFMFSKNIEITFMVLLLTPVSFLVAKFISGRSYKLFRKQTEVRGKQTALINEMVGNEKVVKAFGHEKKASDQFRVLNEELQSASEKAIFLSSLTNPSTRAVNNVIYALVALVGAGMILAGRLTVGGLTVLLTYANQYMKPFNDISSVITELQNAMACAQRIFELIESDSESPDPKALLHPWLYEEGKDGEHAIGAVDISHVAFSYDKSKKLIEDFNFHADPGMKIAIVGPTGCGKTTFINLLMRFYDVDQGSISIDGQKINEVSRGSLRKNYGMVLQDSWIKNGTVRENIAFGKPDASDEEIIRAAKEAHSYEFIRRMPKGLDTMISDEDLSQGEKQLLCISRVMLLMPPMLILDEATSSIDTRTELLIQSAFDKLMQGRTSFIVAHRLSTIRNADVILVMKDGRIIEQGSHDELMKKGGFYTSLYNSQFAGVEI